MSEKRYVVRLSDEERSTLTALLRTEKPVAARKRMHAQVLLKADEGEHGPAWSDEQVAEAFDVHANTVRRAGERGQGNGVRSFIIIFDGVGFGHGATLED